MKVITQGEALEALNQVSHDDHESFSIIGEPEHLGPVSVFFTRIWSGEEVDFEYVMFYRKDGKVKVYDGSN